MWYDSTPIAIVKHYKEYVLPTLKPGEFIEERFGYRQVADIVENGMDAHEKYGSFLLVDPNRPRGYSVAHLEILRSKRSDRHNKEDYGSAELSRIRRHLRQRLKGQTIHAERDKQLRQ